MNNETNETLMLCLNGEVLKQKKNRMGCEWMKINRDRNFEKNV